MRFDQYAGNCIVSNFLLYRTQSGDRNKGLLEVKIAEANEQNKSIINALRAATPTWIFDQINFVAGNHGSVVESDFYTNLKQLDLQEGRKDILFDNQVTQVCVAHSGVILSFHHI